MSDKTESRFALTMPVVMAHPHLFEAQSFQRDGKAKGEPKFGTNLVFPNDSTDLKAIKTLAAQVARAKWPTRAFTEIKWPFSSGDKLADARKAKAGKDDGAYQRGHVVINAKSKYRPKLGVIEGGRIIDLETEEQIAKFKARFYFGALVFAELNLVAYDGGSNPDGVTAYLNQVLSTGKGEKLASGGSSTSETFKAYIGSVSGADPTQGLDDEIPF